MPVPADAPTVVAALDGAANRRFWGGFKSPLLVRVRAYIAGSVVLRSRTTRRQKVRAPVGLRAGAPATAIITAHFSKVRAPAGLRARVVATKLTRPGAPILSGVAGDHRVDLIWSVPADGGTPITGYKVTRNPGGSQFVPSPPTATSYADLTAQNGVQYTYTVVATNTLGDSVASNGVTLTPTTAPTAPAAPILSGSPGINQANLLWTIPADGGSPLTSFSIVRDGFTSFGPFLPPFPPTQMSYVDTTAAGGSTYTYRVLVNNAVGQTGSNVVSVTPSSGGGAPNLPSNKLVGRPASSMIFISSTGMASPPVSDFARWKSNLGFGGWVIRLAGNGYMYAYGGSQRLRNGTATVAPYASDSSYDVQRQLEGPTGLYAAKRSDPTLRCFTFVKLHKPPAGGDLGPFGVDWWDDAGWASVAAAFGAIAGGTRFLGGDGLHFDPEFGHWEFGLGTSTSHGLAQWFAKVHQRGLECGTQIYQAFPDCWCTFYGSFPFGAWHDEVVAHNQGKLPVAQNGGGGAIWGVYNGHSSLNSSQAYVAANASLIANIAHMIFYQGMWQAAAIGGGGGAPLAGPNARWAFDDSFFYHSQVQYREGSVSVDLASAMRWNLWGTLCWLTRDAMPVSMAKATRDWILPRLLVSPTSWAGTDGGDGYWSTQMGEPTYANLLAASRMWGMGGYRTEYMLGPTPGTPDGYQDATPYIAGGGVGPNNQSYGRPRGGIAWGRNIFTGAVDPGAVGHTAVLGNNPQGGGAPGQSVTYGASAVTATPAWSQAFIPPASRAAGMRAAASTTTLSTPLPTVTQLAASLVAGNNVRVTCRVTHPHAPWYVKVYRGAGFNPNNPEPSSLGVATMTFEPNNGTNVPLPIMTNPYASCVLTTTGGGWNHGDWLVIRAVSTKEDELWQPVQIP